MGSAASSKQGSGSSLAAGALTTAPRLRFDSKKYGKVYQGLIDRGVLRAEQFVTPTMATPADLATVHTPAYLASLDSSVDVARIIELPPIACLPASTIRTHVLEPMLLATGGSIIAALLATSGKAPPASDATSSEGKAAAAAGEEAEEEPGVPPQPSPPPASSLSSAASPAASTPADAKESKELKSQPRKQWAINLSGGYHHACSNAGGGFCVYSDITMAILAAARERKEACRKFMIVDLDAHQGNGYERDKASGVFSRAGLEVFILDMYNAAIYPQDHWAKTAIDCKVELKSGTGDEEYLALLRHHLKDSLERFTPDLLVYNAGTDCIAGDPLGRLNVSPDGICERDRIVFQAVLERNVPIAMVLSGGYQKTNAAVIARSIDQLDSQFELISPSIRRARSGDAEQGPAPKKQKLAKEAL